MLTWESGIDNKDKGKKWEGDKGLINLNDPYHARGMRIIMKSTTKYVGITDI